MTQKEKKPRRSQWERWPEESYGPEWRELWLRASRETFSIDFRSERDRNRTIGRAQHYRNQQKKLDREGWRMLYRGTTSRDTHNPCRVWFRPVEEPHREYFAQAGIVAPDESNPLPLETGALPPTPSPSETVKEMDDFMARILAEGPKPAPEEKP